MLCLPNTCYSYEYSHQQLTRAHLAPLVARTSIGGGVRSNRILRLNNLNFDVENENLQKTSSKSNNFYEPMKKLKNKKNDVRDLGLNARC